MMSGYEDAAIEEENKKHYRCLQEQNQQTETMLKEMTRIAASRIYNRQLITVSRLLNAECLRRLSFCERMKNKVLRRD